MPTDRYLVEFRFTDPRTRGLTEWVTVEAATPTSLRDVVALIDEYHEAQTEGRNSTNGLFRCACLSNDTGHWRDVTEDALDAFGRWHLEAYEAWPWWLDVPAWVEAAA